MKAIWITADDAEKGSALYRFTKDYFWEKNTEVTLNISADTRYKLYCNGNYLCEGPCQSDHWFWRY